MKGMNKNKIKGNKICNNPYPLKMSRNKNAKQKSENFHSIKMLLFMINPSISMIVKNNIIYLIIFKIDLSEN